MMGLFSSIAKIAGIVAAPFTGGASLIPSLVTGGLQLAGSLAQNSSAKSIASSANAQSIELANTQHQREVADLRAAGLNPILSAGGSGAAVPSMQVPPVQNVAEKAVSTALQTRLLKAQLENITADTQSKVITSEKGIADTINAQLMAPQIAASARQADALARSAKVAADSDELQGALMKTLGSGSSTAKNLADAIRLIKQLGGK